MRVTHGAGFDRRDDVGQNRGHALVSHFGLGWREHADVAQQRAQQLGAFRMRIHQQQDRVANAFVCEHHFGGEHVPADRAMKARQRH
nr:hypothetical protein [Ralstonia solanacearum]